MVLNMELKLILNGMVILRVMGIGETMRNMVNGFIMILILTKLEEKNITRVS